jgi:hypothetical protein
VRAVLALHDPGEKIADDRRLYHVENPIRKTVKKRAPESLVHPRVHLRVLNDRLAPRSGERAAEGRVR